MRSLLFFLLSIQFTLSNAQELLFNQEILFNDIPQSARLDIKGNPQFLSSRYVRQSSFLSDKDFLIMIEPSLVVISKFSRKDEHTEIGCSSYVGEVSGPAKGEVTFSVCGNLTSGLLSLNDGRRFSINQTAADIFVISEYSNEYFNGLETKPDFEVNEVKYNDVPEPQSALSVCESASACPSPSVIDVMVVFSQQAETNAGGSSNILSAISTAFSNLNSSLLNSGVTNLSFRVVYAKKISYTEAQNLPTDLNRLAGTTDGFIDNIHSLRDQYGADLVALIVATDTAGWCGFGRLNTSSTAYSASNGFSVTKYSCLGNYTLAHEIGHNMGLRHDWYVDNATTPCSHHHGYVNKVAINLGTSSPAEKRWKTIMAYNTQCRDAGFNCFNTNRWSNPNQTFNSDPLGIAIGQARPSNETFSFYRTGCQVAAFRPTACVAPTSLTSSSITAASAKINWSRNLTAASYRVEYRLSTVTTWTLLSSAVTSGSANLTSLRANSTYVWRVRSNCGSLSSAFVQAQFTTLTCVTPTSLTTTSIGPSYAKLSWAAVTNASNYEVSYKLASSSTWTILNASNFTNGSVYNNTAILQGLTAGTSYNWRVRAKCSDAYSNYSQTTFTTLAGTVCSDVYEPNENWSQAKSITFNNQLKASISSYYDQDYFTFVTPNSDLTNIRVTLYGLRLDYDLRLYRPDTTGGGFYWDLGRSQNTGTASETIVFNTTVRNTRYYIQIKAKDRIGYPEIISYDAYHCYLFKVENSASPYALVAKPPAPVDNPTNSNPWSIYPVPAKDILNVFYHSTVKSKAQILLTDAVGRTIQSRRVELLEGSNYYTLNVGQYSPGIYYLKFIAGDAVMVKRVLLVK